MGEDGNAFAILSRCQKQMRRAGVGDQWDTFRAEATSGDYDHLLQTVMDWFSVDAVDSIDDPYTENNTCQSCGISLTAGEWSDYCDNCEDEDE